MELKEVFAEDFHKDIFFVLVCGPFLLIENFSRSSESAPPGGACCAGKWVLSYCNHLISGGWL